MRAEYLDNVRHFTDNRYNLSDFNYDKDATIWLDSVLQTLMLDVGYHTDGDRVQIRWLGEEEFHGPVSLEGKGTRKVWFSLYFNYSKNEHLFQCDLVDIWYKLREEYKWDDHYVYYFLMNYVKSLFTLGIMWQRDESDRIKGSTGSPQFTFSTTIASRTCNMDVNKLNLLFKKEKNIKFEKFSWTR